MKIVRMQTQEGIRYGGVEPEGIRIHDGTPFVAWQPTEVVISFEQARLLAPVFPTKVVGVAANYVLHAEEMGRQLPDTPSIFIKPSTAVIGPSQPIVLPALSNEVHHEAELAVVIGKVARKVAVEDASSVVLGYTAGNDVTARDLRREDGHPSRAKGFDTFCPLGPAIETEYDPLEDFSLECRVNGAIRQGSSINDMIFGVAELISFITSVMTLLPGDVIMTGTPSGVGPLRHGDLVEVTLEGVGTLSNPVVAE
ncbi:MAG: fumarylacetoacetate hydrolase family protein [bacterium]|nr:fumarylacetoacetate hydrolase family protein [bacterium]MDE0287165.1 fumarylacetoacetate hydrolase family protein [bacterium]MDE0437508.1 fumarylacetoacetate hydrolase family protein [bacterium]